MSATSIYYGKILHYGKCIIGLAVKHYLVVYPKHGAMIGLMHNFQTMKANNYVKEKFRSMATCKKVN